MKKYIQFFKTIILCSLLRSSAFQLDFWLRIVMDIVYYSSLFAVYYSVYLFTDNLNGWDFRATLFLLAIWFLIDSFHMAFLATGTWSLPSVVNQGLFDSYLLKPVNCFIFSFFNKFEPSSFYNLLLSVGFLVIVALKFEITAVELITFICIFPVALLTSIFLRVLFILPCFFLETPYAFMRLFMALKDYGTSPSDIFPPLVRFILGILLPFLVIASLPAKFIVTQNFETLFVVALGSSLLSIFTIWMWNKAINHYQSASS